MLQIITPIIGGVIFGNIAKIEFNPFNGVLLL
ncbi:hypothetical protein CPL00124_CDS0191 [Escherchia phage Stokescottia]|uniref:Uncharacterized protein n=1 Tax=Salmonella phage L6jm TaxID=2713222 RepID=A0A6G6XR32_9CAUD|nr:hypothetical protein HWD08_gp005 [Salmonella phage L6jm]YP_009856560.1 hypothetical protein HWD08_gp164 [Salmonella phage L6jm]QIG61116.1 hypothetical protein [Salmonella phage L6jm]QIG61275.1 hypothetical protein [Salmonella phage L6jm]